MTPDVPFERFCDVSVVASAPGGLGIEFAKPWRPHFSLAAQVTWFLALGDAALVVRRTWPAGTWGAPYVAGGGYALWSPVLFPEPLGGAAGALGALGWEWRPAGALVLSAEFGVGLVYVPKGSEGGGGYVAPVPRPQLRIGWRI